LFLQIRIKSIGDTSDVGLECQQCKEDVQTVVNLHSMEVVGLDKKLDNLIKLSETITLEMRYPSLSLLSELPMNEEGDTDTLGVFKLLNKCVISITDGEEVFTRDDFSEKELDKFLEGMSIQMLDQVQEFMNSIPKLIIRHQYQCEACESNSEIELEGIASFFG
jgi:predicted DNA-binding antitoxin AbrB/MazE fold protein